MASRGVALSRAAPRFAHSCRHVPLNAPDRVPEIAAGRQRAFGDLWTTAAKPAKTANVFGWRPSYSWFIHVSQDKYWQQLESERRRQSKAANVAHGSKTAKAFGGRTEEAHFPQRHILSRNCSLQHQLE
jgi:hypothetical protein